MGLQLTRRAPGWDGNIVGPNTVTLRLPIGLTYHQVYTEYVFNAGALLLADAIAEVRVVANGKPIWNIQASELDTYNKFNGRNSAGTIAGGVLVIDFDRFGLRMRSSEELTSLGTPTYIKPCVGVLSQPSGVVLMLFNRSTMTAILITLATIAVVSRIPQARVLVFGS